MTARENTSMPLMLTYVENNWVESSQLYLALKFHPTVKPWLQHHSNFPLILCRATPFQRNTSQHKVCVCACVRVRACMCEFVYVCLCVRACVLCICMVLIQINEFALC